MSRIKEFGIGFGYIRKGFGFFMGNKGLWPYAVIPTLINLAFLTLLISILVHYFGDLSGWIFGGGEETTPAGLLAKMWHYIAFLLLYIVKIILFLMLLILILIITFVLSMVLAEPFNDMLSEKVEELGSGGSGAPFSWNRFARSVWRSIIVGLQKAGFFLIVPLILLILNIIPLIGSVLYIILTTLFAAFDIGFNFVDYPMSLRLWKFGERLRFGWANRYFLAGFGIVALIPFLPYIFAAPMVAGGTLLFEKLANNDICRLSKNTQGT